MKQIGFRNFRKFEDFPYIEIGGVTLMVGGNNSGKSTVVKAILLVLDYLKNQQTSEFTFLGDTFDSANVITFDRALCKNQPEKHIDFFIQLRDFEVSIRIAGHAGYGICEVVSITIVNNTAGIKYDFNYRELNSTISKTVEVAEDSYKVNSDINTQVVKIEEVHKEMALLSPQSKDYLQLADKLGRLKTTLEHMNTSHRDDHDDMIAVHYSLSNHLSPDRHMSNSNFIEMVDEFLLDTKNKKKLLISKREKAELGGVEFTEEEAERMEEISRILSEESLIKGCIEKFRKVVLDCYVYHWSAEPKKQSTLLLMRDKNNALAQAVHEFYQLKLGIECEEKRHVKCWMKDFDIGVDFAIKSYVSEAYEVDIKDESGVSVSIADMGMGSIQLMTLFFRLAVIIRKHKEKESESNVTLMIEEPELNLHPALQSKLADLFYKVNEEYGVKFIVETHSEYLIRRTQVLVKNYDFKDQQEVDNLNCFKTYYFSRINSPYRMIYRTDGKFKNAFETGFFDEAANLVFKAL